MSEPSPRHFFIQGVTLDGRTFRPSDWAERLCGAMSCFRPGTEGASAHAYIGYSPYCVPRLINGTKCVVVNEKLREIEPMAWDFVVNFARDNQLQHGDGCLLPEPARVQASAEDHPAPAPLPPERRRARLREPLSLPIRICDVRRRAP